MTAASWYHCSVKPVSRSAGRSVVAAAAYRLGERLHDEHYAMTHDYTRRRGVEATFTVAPLDAPEWAHNPESLWNAAERAETRKNSTLAREVELALPSLLSPDERHRIAEQFAAELVERYKVAVSVAIHEPGRGDERNYHAHILFTTREVTPDGLGKKTRILDDRKTGPQEVIKLRELAADIINQSLAAVNSDIRVDHRSFKDRGIEREPSTHLGPAASEMERRGAQTERGNINRDAEQVNTLIDDRAALDTAIVQEEERASSPPKTVDDERERIRNISPQVEAAAEPESIASPPATREQEQQRIRQNVAPINRAIQETGAWPDSYSDGMTWWQRAALHVASKARNLMQAFTEKARGYWQDFIRADRQPPPPRDREPDDRGMDR